MRSWLLVVLLAIAPLTAVAGAVDDFFHAAKVDDADSVTELLRRGFDPNLTDAERGETALILAVREGSIKVIDALLQARGIQLERTARNGDTALMIAAYKSNVPVVQALLKKKAQVNRPGWTPLHYAAAAGNNEIVSLLLEESAYIDAESPNQTTPLMMAAQAGHIYTVKLLLDEGADATLRNEKGLSALDFASRFNHADIVEGLTYRLRKAGKL